MENNNQNENKLKKFPIKKHKHTNMTEKNAQIFSCFSSNKHQQIVVRILKNNGPMLLKYMRYDRLCLVYEIN